MISKKQQRLKRARATRAKLKLLLEASLSGSKISKDSMPTRGAKKRKVKTDVVSVRAKRSNTVAVSDTVKPPIKPPSVSGGAKRHHHTEQ